MNFQVPQFIEVEDKIFGPLTFKQFIYLSGGAGAAFLAHAFLPFYLEIIPVIALIGLSFLLAFYKFNKRPFVMLLESMFNYSTHGKFYIWQQDKKAIESKLAAIQQNPEPKQSQIRIPSLSSGRLQDLAWSLDVQETIK
ncbi:MAG TPA: PrgI family protein [Candidatus Paceibacterota bacterium]|nr:PrgI family protein [Candidatus Paceibacterota bacterium]